MEKVLQKKNQKNITNGQFKSIFIHIMQIYHSVMAY